MADIAEIEAARGATPAAIDAQALESSLERVLAGAPIAILIEGAGGRLLWRNAALEKALGTVDEADADPIGTFTARAAERGLTCTRVALAPDCTTAGNDDRGRDAIRAVRYFVPTTDKADARGLLLRLLDSRPGLDAETGVLDGTGINRALQTEVSRSRRYGNPLSVVMLRMAGGLDTLRAVARMLKEELRWADLIGRVDEHTLLVVLPETGADAASHLLAKVRGMLARDAATRGRRVARLGAAGWCCGDDSDTLLQRASEALEAEAEIA